MTKATPLTRVMVCRFCGAKPEEDCDYADQLKQGEDHAPCGAYFPLESDPQAVGDDK